MNYMMITIGVVLAALANWFFGALWYSPVLFGNKWIQLGKISVDQNKMKSAMINGLIVALVMASVMACFMFRFQITTISSAALFAFEAWLGFVATVTSYQVIYENKPAELYVLNNGYNLIGMILTALVLTFFI